MFNRCCISELIRSFCPKNSTIFSFSGFQGVILLPSLAGVGHHLDEFGLLHLEDAALVEERRQDHFYILQCSEQPTHPPRKELAGQILVGFRNLAYVVCFVLR